MTKNADSLVSLLVRAGRALEQLRAARELGLIARLDQGPISPAALAAATGTDPDRLHELLEALVSLGLVSRRPAPGDEHGECFSTSEPLSDVVSTAIDEAAAAPVVDAFRFARNEVFGMPGADSRSWLETESRGIAAAEALLRDDHGLTCHVLSPNPEVSRASTRISVHQLQGRFAFVPGDFIREPLPEGYDVVSFTRVLQQWPDDIAFLLLRKARRALGPRRRIIVCEESRAPRSCAPASSRSYFRDVEWYAQCLRVLGFLNIRVIPGSVDLLAATTA